MINIFRRKKQRPSQIQLGFRLAGARIDKEQHKWADYLNGKTAKTSHTSKLIGLILVCFLFGGSSISLIVHGFNKSENVKIEKISVPLYVITKDTANAFIPVPILTSKEYRNIQRFKKSMDSLQTTAEGKLKYDSIYKARPGLMDSVEYTEQLFFNQQNSK